MRAMVLLSTMITILFVHSALAKPYTLKCTTVEGYPPVNLVIDLEDRIMTLGATSSRYTITNIADEYITGFERADTDPPVGGEIMVLNRFNGNYKRAWVGMFCKDPPPNCEGGNTVLRADTVYGKCFGPML